MTRLVVGPFNRVEGDLEVTLDVVDGLVREARVTAPLYRGFETLLAGRPGTDALMIAPRICGICSVSQSVATAAALRDVAGAGVPANGMLATALANAAENVADHLTHFVIFFMPDVTRPAYAGRPWHAAAVDRFRPGGTAAAELLPARARLLHVMGEIAGKWPHSLAFQPGGTTLALDLGARMRVLAAVRDFRAVFERVVLGGPVEAFAALTTVDALDAFAEAHPGDVAAFWTIARDAGFDRLGAGPGLLASGGAYRLPGDRLAFAAGVVRPDGTVEPLRTAAITEDPSHAWMTGTVTHPAAGTTRPDVDKPGGYSFAKAPRLGGEPVEVGALARQVADGHPLARALLGPAGRSNVRARVVARMIEIARLLPLMEDWARGLDPAGSYAVPVPDDVTGTGEGLVEAARGLLGHWVHLDRGRIAGYQIVSPTTWNFSPRDSAGIPGPLEQALTGIDVGPEGAASVTVQHVVRSFDPCMVCTAH